MLLFAHTGITLGCALLIDKTLKSIHSRSFSEQYADSHNAALQTENCNVSEKHNNSLWSALVTKHIDYRFIILGSILPDIIDKPLGVALLPEFFNSSRIIFHTLLFLIIIITAGIFLFKKRGTIWLLLIAFGVFIHLILDQIWLMPHTFLWPVYGMAFEPTDPYHWLEKLLYSLQNNPTVFIMEIIGFSILLATSVYLIIKRKVLRFIKTGSIL